MVKTQFSLQRKAKWRKSEEGVVSALVKAMASSPPSLQILHCPCLRKGPDFLMSTGHCFSYSHMKIGDLMYLSEI